ncbi:Probable type I restriction enzyme BthVORF4518P M protein [uncultured Clostridium sp.]|uniref:HsdM family class I SAM-dependent methyltransferase n=1 Tax=uncultured Clostridium sp. TaxID=59620 RepID=UPI00082207AF|nr:N-6 DNA methylase [uncultured Clostridium sp.]SCK02024.1 Probable type I restriction enzyme BthVORF4518P M protein [uncultured Clostridium sp.]
MSEQTIQNDLYSYNVSILDKYECLSLGATTVKNLIATKRIKKININDKLGDKKPDVLIIDKLGQVIIYQEQKVPNKFKSEKDIKKAIKQEIEVAKALNAKIYIVSDGEQFIWINPLTGNKILDVDGNPINIQVKPKENAKILVELINNVILSIDKDNDQLLKKEYLDPTSLAKKINGILKNLTFASAKMSLYTFVEVFLFKYLSDIGILTGDNSFEYIYKMYSTEYKNNVDCNITDAKVLGKYLEGPRETMKMLFPMGEDGTSIINGKVFHVEKDQFNNYVSSDNTDMIFKQVIVEFKKYEEENDKFINISKDFKSKLFETFMKNSDDKSDMGQFFTPLKVVKEMVNMIDIREGMKICDPACGVGKFLLEAVEDKIDDYYYMDDNNNLVKKVELIGYDKMMSEKDDITIILAKANMLIYLSKLFKKNNTLIDVQRLAREMLNDTYKLHKTMLGTLEKVEHNKYDVIIANPPYYQSKLMRDEANKTEQYKLGGSGVEALFLEWCLKSLKYGGVANIVLPDGIFSNISNNTIKNYILNNFYIESIISLPINTFFNTPKKTYILTVKKKTEIEIEKNKKQDYPVFSYICKSIGETLDANRFDKLDDNDLHEAVCKYNNYKNIPNKSDIQEPFKTYFDSDNKLKMIDIKEFTESGNWSIENWWTEDEKIEIGLRKAVVNVTIDDFNNLLDDTINLINEFKGELKCMK